mgnify:FL=1
MVWDHEVPSSSLGTPTNAFSTTARLLQVDASRYRFQDLLCQGLWDENQYDLLLGFSRFAQDSRLLVNAHTPTGEHCGSLAVDLRRMWRAIPRGLLRLRHGRPLPTEARSRRRRQMASVGESRRRRLLLPGRRPTGDIDPHHGQGTSPQEWADSLC